MEMSLGRIWRLYACHFMVFSAYVELAPGLGSIWFRIGADGYRHVNLESYLHFLTRPLFMRELWSLEYWDINYFVNVGLVIGIYVLLGQLGTFS